MARIKSAPRVAQPDLERQALPPETQAMSSAINGYQVMSNQASDDEVNHETKKRILPRVATITGSGQLRAQGRSAAEELVNIGNRPALKDVTCPQCLSRFPDMGIKVSQI